MNQPHNLWLCLYLPKAVSPYPHVSVAPHIRYLLGSRHLQFACFLTSTGQELNQQTFRSLSFLCDASPKAFKEETRWS